MVARVSNLVFEANVAGKHKWYEKDLAREKKKAAKLDNRPTERQIIARLRKVEQKDQYMMFELMTGHMSPEEQNRIIAAV